MPICFSTYADPKTSRLDLGGAAQGARLRERLLRDRRQPRRRREARAITSAGASIVDPRGTILAEAGMEKAGLLVAEIDLDDVDKARSSFPGGAIAGLDLYGNLEPA